MVRQLWSCSGLITVTHDSPHLAASRKEREREKKRARLTLEALFALRVKSSEIYMSKGETRSLKEKHAHPPTSSTDRCYRHRGAGVDVDRHWALKGM